MDEIGLGEAVIGANRSAIKKFRAEQADKPDHQVKGWNEKTVGTPGTEIPLLSIGKVVKAYGGIGSTPPLSLPDRGGNKVLEIPAEDVTGTDWQTRQKGPIMPSLKDVVFDVVVRDAGVLDIQAVLKDNKGPLVQAMREHRKAGEDISTFEWEHIANQSAQEIDDVGTGSGNSREVQMLLRTKDGEDGPEHYVLVVASCANTIESHPRVTLRMVPIENPEWVEQTYSHMSEPVINRSFIRSIK